MADERRDAVERDYLGDVIRSVTELLDAKYPQAGHATLVVNIGDELPRVSLPILRRGTSGPPRQPS